MSVTGHAIERRGQFSGDNGGWQFGGEIKLEQRPLAVYLDNARLIDVNGLR